MFKTHTHARTHACTHACTRTHAHTSEGEATNHTPRKHQARSLGAMVICERAHGQRLLAEQVLIALRAELVVRTVGATIRRLHIKLGSSSGRLSKHVLASRTSLRTCNWCLLNLPGYVPLTCPSFMPAFMVYAVLPGTENKGRNCMASGVQSPNN